MDRLERQMLQTLKAGPVSVYRLLDAQDGTLPEFFQRLQALQQRDWVQVEHGQARLTPTGQRAAETLVAAGPLRCAACEGTGYRFDPFFQHVLTRYRELIATRPRAIERYDQGYISPEGVVRRVAFMYERGDLYGDIFIVGDDDLLSLAAALTGMPRRIVVVDIDERLITFINRVAHDQGFPVRALVYDVQQAFPDDLRGQFDVFVTDPVETVPGLELFLSRGVSTLRGVGSAGYFGLTTLEASRRKWYTIQRMIHDMGLVITDIRRQFNVYPDEGETNFFRYQEKLPIVQKLGARVDHDWYKSALYRLEAVEPPRPRVEGARVIDEQVYKDEESWATPY